MHFAYHMRSSILHARQEALMKLFTFPRTIGLLVLLAVTGLTAAVLSLGYWGPIGSVEVADGTLAQTQRGDEAPAHGVEVTAFVTGWVQAPADILMDQTDPGTPEHLTAARWVPSLAYAIRHPQQGIVVLDTGLRAGVCDYGLRPAYWVPCRNAPGEDLVSQLQAAGISGEAVTQIIVSHFHGDHISGLSPLLNFTTAPVTTTRASLEAVRSPFRAIQGIPAAMLATGMQVQLIDDDMAPGVAGLETHDVFGDGSLQLFATPGHAAGHVSAYVRGAQRDVVLTFDAAHLRENYELEIPSGAVTSRRSALESLARLKALVETLDDPLIILVMSRTNGAAWTDRRASIKTRLNASLGL
jgi:N-acyl homoserine lactone hydrolase